MKTNKKTKTKKKKRNKTKKANIKKVLTLVCSVPSESIDRNFPVSILRIRTILGPKDCSSNLTAKRETVVIGREEGNNNQPVTHRASRILFAVVVVKNGQGASYL